MGLHRYLFGTIFGGLSQKVREAAENDYNLSHKVDIVFLFAKEYII